MKNIILTIVLASLFLMGDLVAKEGDESTSASSSISANQKELTQNEMFREESMRKFAIGNTSVQLKKGTVWIYAYGDITLHAYETKDTFGTFVFILEKAGKAVLLESPPMKDNYDELTNYITGLGHKEVDLIVSYHPIGAQFINTDKLKFTQIYSMKHAVDFYTTGEGVPSLAGLKSRYGTAFDETVYKPTVMLEEGIKVISGITFDFTQADIAFDVAIPEINSVHPHMLGHDKHTLVFSYEFLDAAIAQLERYQDRGYEMFFSSHSEPETRGDVTIKLSYLRALKNVAQSSKNKQMFITKMNERYPNFGWPFYLQGTANFLFDAS